MEKFGIFELLDMLSAISAVNPQEEAAAEPAAERTEAEKIQPRTDDAAYLPPQYGGSEPAAEAAGGKNALGAFLERHNAISKKIDGER